MAETDGMKDGIDFSKIEKLTSDFSALYLSSFKKTGEMIIIVLFTFCFSTLERY